MGGFIFSSSLPPSLHNAEEEEEGEYNLKVEEKEKEGGVKMALPQDQY